MPYAELIETKAIIILNFFSLSNISIDFKDYIRRNKVMYLRE